MKPLQIKYVLKITSSNHVEYWRTLTEFCSAYGQKYNTWKVKKFPFEYQGRTFEKIPAEIGIRDQEKFVKLSEIKPNTKY